MGKSIHHEIFYTPLEQAHSYLAQSCLMFATLEGFIHAAAAENYHLMDPEDWSSRYHPGLQVFAEYCVKYWVYHLKQSGSLLPITKKLLLSYCTTNLSNFNFLLLLSTDNDWWLEDLSDVSPLQAMCYFGVTLAVSFLVDSGADIEKRDNDGCTALSFAGIAGHWGIVYYLVDHGADITVETEYGNILHSVVWSGPIDLLRTLVRNVVKANRAPDEDNKTPLEYSFGDNARAMAIVESVVEKEEVLMLHLSRGTGGLGGAAVEESKLEAMLYLVQLCDNVNKRDEEGGSPLHYAYTVEICEALVKKGANINAEDSTGHTPLHYACNAAIARFLVMNGADIFCRNFSGQTPLDIVDDPETKESLVKAAVELSLRGPNLGWRGQNGDSILHSAIKSGKECIVESLVQQGVNVNSRDNQGNTPLDLAVRAGNIEMVRTLINLGGDVNVPSEGGELPLGVAVKQDNTKVVEILISGGSDPCLRDSSGMTPLENALWVGNQKVICILQNGAVG